MKTKHTVVNADCRKMSYLKDKSVHLIITSPPYWQLKDYGTDTQIGFHDTYEEYINNLNLVWSESLRVLQDGCRLCINIGDQFARAVYYGRYKVIPIRTEIIKFCEIIGFDYMGSIIWQKVTTTNTTGGASIMGSFPYPRNGILKLDYEFILIFKKQGKPPIVDKTTKEQSKMTTEEWNKYFCGHWNFAGAKQEGHHAQFPEELPKRLIKMFSFVGDIVLDPFLGSGTTALAAKNLDRNSVGYEINPEYIPVIKKKLEFDQGSVFENDIEFISCSAHIDAKHRIDSLPYIFVDPHKFDSKVDIKKLQYGSKISQEQSKREELFSVKDILSPILMRLDNGITVQLIGLKERTSQNIEAMAYLRSTIRGANVYLRYDSTKYSDTNLLCYMYLKNRTFVNAHLLKRGFVEVDKDFDFRYKDKFIGINEEVSNGI